MTHFNKMIDFHNLYLIPEIQIVIDMPQYTCHNLSIELHFLGWHCRWLILKEDK